MKVFFTNLPKWLGVVLLSNLCASVGVAQVFSPQDTVHPVFSKQAMVATQEHRASVIGLDILKQGGNAIDAAVAVGFALAVTLPRAGNLGGGGFMMIHHAKRGETVAIDYREMAPAGASRDMFLNAAGNVDKKRARFSHLSVGVPGTPAGLLLALEQFGTMSRAKVMAPAIRMAEEGIEISPAMTEALKFGAKRLKKWPSSRAIFLTEDGSPPALGTRLKQIDLAQTLRLIAEKGIAGFYEGRTAALLAQEMALNGGLINENDLRAYVAKIREPVWGTYRGFEIFSMPPPSSGGVHLVQILNILEGFPIAEFRIK